MVLGCTHFPHLKEELTALAEDINWIDSADAIAKRCISLLTEANSPHIDEASAKPEMHFYSSADIEHGLQQTLTQYGFTDIQENVQLYDVELNSINP